jgi:gluconate 5-dehydrogenase
MAGTKDLFSLDGRVALVTGGSKGLGAAMAHAMAEFGAHVVLNGRSAERLNAKVEEFKAEGLKASACPFDVTDWDAATAAVNDLAKEHGHIDVLVNNAGMSTMKRIADLTKDEWFYEINIHLNAAYFLSREVAKPMTKQGKGSIINLTSIVGPIMASDRETPYAAGKGGLMGLTRGMAIELGPKGIRTNSIAPGYFHTELGGFLEEGKPPSAEMKPMYDAIEARVPLRRFADPTEIGGLAVYLASDASSFVNGALIVIDGGISGAMPYD